MKMRTGWRAIRACFAYVLMSCRENDHDPAQQSNPHPGMSPTARRQSFGRGCHRRHFQYAGTFSHEHAASGAPRWCADAGSRATWLRITATAISRDLTWVGGGVNAMLAALLPSLDQRSSWPGARGGAGWLNDCAWRLSRSQRQPAGHLDERAAMANRWCCSAPLLQSPSAGHGRILLLLHGLCMNDLQWQSRTARRWRISELGYTPLYLHYISTISHISVNGHHGILGTLLQQWPAGAGQRTGITDLRCSSSMAKGWGAEVGFCPHMATRACRAPLLRSTALANGRRHRPPDRRRCTMRWSAKPGTQSVFCARA